MLCQLSRSSHPRIFLGKGVLKICRRAPMLKCNFNKVASYFIEIALRHGCFSLNLFHILWTAASDCPPSQMSGGGALNTPLEFLIYAKAFLAKIYLYKVNNRNTIKRCKNCSNLRIKTTKRHQWRRFGVFIVNFKHISHLFLNLKLLTLTMYLFVGLLLFVIW